jgi:transposase InsO family protein
MTMECDTGNVLKKFWSDKGEGFCSKIFGNFLIEKKIIRHTSTPYTPQHNGFIERGNMTVTKRLEACYMQRIYT